MHDLRTLPYLQPAGTEVMSLWPSPDHRPRSGGLLWQCRLRAARDRAPTADRTSRPAPIASAVAVLMVGVGDALERAGAALRTQAHRVAPG